MFKSIAIYSYLFSYETKILKGISQDDLSEYKEDLRADIYFQTDNYHT